ncbi:MAG: hypothetical protein J5905_05375 [Prevotella sp.]|nr:hypothetical protein [Prevotella sp.]
MKIFFLAVFSFIALTLVFGVVRVIFTFILDIVSHGILPFLIVRFLTWTMEHWMGSTIAWTLSITAGIIWGVYPRLKQWVSDPQDTIHDVREREARLAREHNEFLRWKNSEQRRENDDYVKEEVERCDTEKYD